MLNLKNESSTNAFVETFHWQFISLLYCELRLGRITPFKLACFCSTHELSALRDSAVRIERTTVVVKLISTNYVETAKKGELVMTLTFTVNNPVPYVTWQTSTGAKPATFVHAARPWHEKDPKLHSSTSVE